MFRNIIPKATRVSAFLVHGAPSTRLTGMVGRNNLTSIRTMSAVPPSIKPKNPEFSSGPCKKHPGYDISTLDKRVLGRSHRSKIGKERLALAIDESKRLLKLPEDYMLGIVPASDTGAYEMAMWGMLGQRDIDICHWESFGKGWFGDAISHLNLRDSVTVNEHTADYGSLPDFSKTNPKK